MKLVLFEENFEEILFLSSENYEFLRTAKTNLTSSLGIIDVLTYFTK